jgi:hypothetical protein
MTGSAFVWSPRRARPFLFMQMAIDDRLGSVVERNRPGQALSNLLRHRSGII